MKLTHWELIFAGSVISVEYHVAIHYCMRLKSDADAKIIKTFGITNNEMFQSLNVDKFNICHCFKWEYCQWKCSFMREVWFNNQHFCLLYVGDSSSCTRFHLPLLGRKNTGQRCFLHVLFLEDLCLEGCSSLVINVLLLL